MNARPLAIVLLAGFLLACTAPRPDRSGPTPADFTGPTGEEGSEDPDPGPPSHLADHPVLVFTADGHSFGRQEQETRVRHTAVFYNGGREPLVIREVKTHCGCAAALLSDRTIPPGGRGTMHIVFDTGSIPGRRSRNVEVRTNDPESPVTTYPITCQVIADAVVDPILLVVQATRSAGPIHTSFEVFSLRPGFHLVIEGIETSRPGIHTKVEPLPPGAHRSGYRVEVTLGPDFGQGDFHERVTVLTNSERNRRLAVDILGTIENAVLAVPERLYFPHLAPGEKASRRLFVYRTDGKPLDVTGVEDASGLFEIRRHRTGSSRWELDVLLAGEAPTHRVRGSLVIGTDSPENPRVTVPFEIPGADR